MKYHIARNGQQAGTFTEEEIRARLQTNEFSSADLCWTDGMGDWQPLGARFAQLAASSSAEPASDAIGAGVINPYAPPQAAIAAPLAGGSLELATLGQRLGASMLDSLIAVLCVIPAIIGIAMMDGSTSESPPPVALGLFGLTGLLFLGLLIWNLVLLATRGQTIAKKWLGIRIVTFPEGANPGGVKTILLRLLVNGLIGAVPLLGPIYSLVDICFIFREDRRCIHDLIAGTQVVKGQPPGL